MDYVDDSLLLRTGQRLATRTWGSGARRVLALHGWIDNAASFSTLAPMLDGITFTAVDFPGHGQSDWRPPTAEYHYVNWIPVVWDALDALGWDRASLVGHSMGAGVAALAAGVLGDRLDRVVLIEGLGPYTTPTTGMLDNLGRAMQGREVQFQRTPRVMAGVEMALQRKLAALPYLGEHAKALVERGTRPVEGGVAFSHDPRLTARSMLRYTEPQVLAHFRAIHCPVLLILARDGLQYPDSNADSAARLDALTTAEVVRVDGHHHVHLTHPERVAPYVQAFLQD